MQISSRSHDYVVDTLALRSYLGAALAAPFADPLILKILHGADRDVEWLQKDFGLFVVNMFDTGQAAHLLGLPRGLGKLLQHFCQVSVRTPPPLDGLDTSLPAVRPRTNASTLQAPRRVCDHDCILHRAALGGCSCRFNAGAGGWCCRQISLCKWQTGGRGR